MTAKAPPQESTAIELADPKAYEVALQQRLPRLEELLAGTDITPARFIGMTTQALARDPKLLAPDVDRQSLLLAILSVAEMGLAPTGAFGGAWLVPYWDKKIRKKRVQPITDWRGFIKMAFRSGQLRGVWAELVYEGEYFEVQYGTTPQIAHHYALERDAAAKVTHVYAVAHLVTGERVFEVMTRAEVDAIRARAKAQDDGPWATDWGEMARKTVVRRLFKYVPVAVTPALAAALASEDEWEQITQQPITQAAWRPTDRRASILSAVGVDIPVEEAEPPTEDGATADAADGTGTEQASGESVSGAEGDDDGTANQ